MFSVVSFKGGLAEGGSHYPHLKLSEGFPYTFFYADVLRVDRYKWK
jgi:hypothetical protein